MDADERSERAMFARWMKRAHPGVSTRRYGKTAQNQYIVSGVNDAWKGWFARSKRYTRVELDRAAKRGKELAARLARIADA